MNIEPNELDIVCFHVGGFGDYSHINVFGSKYPRKTVYVAFEARESADDEKVKQEYLDKGIRTILVQKCVADTIGTRRFNINVQPASSSIYTASAAAMTEHMPDQDALPRWGSHATTERTIELETTTIDDAIKTYKLPKPNVLSIDAQGAEYGIMKGGLHALSNDVMSVITEVEFYPIYEGQPLFHNQFELLKQCGFRLVDILAMQYWHPVARVGHGMLTVGEALFMRFGYDYLQTLTAEQLIKYSAMALAYKRLSLAVCGMNIAVEKFGSRIVEILRENKEYAELLWLQRHVISSMDKYAQNAFFFEKDATLLSRYGSVENLTNRSLP
jgi:FkbM family methyltransferase